MPIKIRNAIDKRRYVSSSSRSMRLWYGGVAASLLAVFGQMWSLREKNVKEKPSIRKKFYRGAKEHITFITDHLGKFSGIEPLVLY